MKTEPFMFYAGNPARPVKKRVIGLQDPAPLAVTDHPGASPA